MSEKYAESTDLKSILKDILLAIDKLAWRVNIDKDDPEIRILRIKDLSEIKNKINNLNWLGVPQENFNEDSNA